MRVRGGPGWGAEKGGGLFSIYSLAPETEAPLMRLTGVSVDLAVDWAYARGMVAVIAGAVLAAWLGVYALAGSNRLTQWRYERRQAAEARDRQRVGVD